MSMECLRLRCSNLKCSIVGGRLWPAARLALWTMPDSNRVSWPSVVHKLQMSHHLFKHEKPYRYPSYIYYIYCIIRRKIREKVYNGHTNPELNHKEFQISIPGVGGGGGRGRGGGKGEGRIAWWELLPFWPSSKMFAGWGGGEGGGRASSKFLIFRKFGLLAKLKGPKKSVCEIGVTIFLFS